ncbi:hypothetical protein CIT292_06020 [Citrobacter youngae ATCC 29220]|uniref:Uncharacterized protein n=1 Tax=Citrobacter youngae ATCC 29220 TaxID=500640 RepID=D4B6T1_9ENTR|nr:hypothetical protein CIT292_06020 [Citrobacter youngae ATCC 29220]
MWAFMPDSDAKASYPAYILESPSFFLAHTSHARHNNQAVSRE